MDDDIQRALRDAALEEAARYGSAKPKSVLGKLLGDNPALRPRARELGALVGAVVAEVNALPPDAVAAQAPGQRAPREQPDDGELPPLETDGPVVLRFAPGPSGPLHLGHSRAVALNAAYRELHDGKLILRLEDTNPQAVDPAAYAMIPEDLAWLGVEPDEAVIQSDRMELYYADARELVARGAAYVCDCPAAEWRGLKNDGRPCPHRALATVRQVAACEALFDGGDSGGGIVVVKTDIDHPNPALRDFVALRPVAATHPRQGDRYRLWPSYNFAVAVDDYRLGVTHVLRGKDHLNNTFRQQRVYRHLGWREPRFIHYGLVAIPDAQLKTSTVRAGLASGEYEGWDDCRLATLRALRRRGYCPEALRQFWVAAGVKEVDITFSWVNLDAANRALVDPEARRLFCVPDPVEFTFDAPAAVEKRAPWHPDRPAWGHRCETVAPGATLALPRDDAETLGDGATLRLKNLCTVTRRGDTLLWAGAEPVRGVPVVQWVAAHRPLALHYPDGTVQHGVVEPAATECDDEVVQFERVGFARLEGGRAFFLHR